MDETCWGKLCWNPPRDLASSEWHQQSTIKTGGGTPGGHPLGLCMPAAHADQPLGPTAAGVQCGQASHGAAPPQPRETPSLILGVECTFERSSTHSSHTWCANGQANMAPRPPGRATPSRRSSGSGYKAPSGWCTFEKSSVHQGHQQADRRRGPSVPQEGAKAPCSRILKQGPGNPAGRTARRRDSSAAGEQINMVTSGGETGGKPRLAA